MKALANSYLNHKKTRRDAGELSPHTWQNYEQAAFLVEHLGKSRVVDALAGCKKVRQAGRKGSSRATG